MSPGYIYVLELSTGIIKVGKTDDFDRRFREHQRDNTKRGVLITRQARRFVADMDEAERVLIRWARANMTPMPSGNEYFRGSFNAAVAALDIAGRAVSSDYRARSKPPFVYGENFIALVGFAVSITLWAAFGWALDHPVQALILAVGGALTFTLAVTLYKRFSHSRTAGIEQRQRVAAADENAPPP